MKFYNKNATYARVNHAALPSRTFARTVSSQLLGFRF